MNSRLFESFCEMLESIPSKAVLRAVDAERRMVEDDLEKQRTERDEYVVSILSFCNFLIRAVTGGYVSLPAFPVEHCAFYRKIVHRLVDAGELPPEMMTQFDKIFFRSLSRALNDEPSVPGGQLAHT
jgi:hypothetical protein